MLRLRHHPHETSSARRDAADAAEQRAKRALSYAEWFNSRPLNQASAQRVSEAYLVAADALEEAGDPRATGIRRWAHDIRRFGRLRFEGANLIGPHGYVATRRVHDSRWRWQRLDKRKLGLRTLRYFDQVLFRRALGPRTSMVEGRARELA